ncbi:MAG: hypothetical protein WAY02_08210 [Burkholderiaceae bacterium]
MASTYAPDTRQNLVDYAVMALCLLGVFIAFEIRDFAYFRDYAIAFEGSYRLFLGQVPYRDFGAPVGPASFVIPALFFKLFEPNWTVFLLSQQFQNACLLVLVYALLGRIGTRALIRRIALLSFSVFYLLLLTHPWYNSTGALLLVAGALCALGSSRISVVAAGLLAGLAVLAKQDFGLLTLLIAGFFVAVVSLGSDRDKILPGLDCMRDRARLLALAINLLLFAFSAVAVIALFIQATDAEQFKYWFNYGQKPHEARSISLRDLFGNSFGTLGWVTSLIALARNNFRLLVASIFITAASVSRTTSGLGFTHYYFVAFLPVIVDECLQLKIRFKALVVLVELYTSARVMIRPVSDVYHVFESVALHQPEHFFFDYRKLSRPMAGFPAELQAFSPHMQAPQQTIDTILELKRIAAEKRAAAPGAELKVLNLTELTPIYTELSAAPPKGLPLWFHTKVSIFPRQIDQLNETLAGQAFDIILLQGTHEGLTAPYRNFLSILNANRSYALLREIQDSPANATWPCEPDCQGEIFVYVKRSAFTPR